MPTVRSIAADLNLSTATVSRALRGMDGVNEATRARVRMAAERLGYGRGRRLDTRKTVALVIASKSQADMHELARRFLLVINEEFAKRGWALHPVYIAGEEAESIQTLRALRGERQNGARRLDGCLVIGRLPGHSTEPLHKLLVECFDGNVVMLSRHDVLNGLSGVTQMNYDGGVQAARLLTDAGHRRLGWVGALGSRDSAAERLGGVLTVLREVGAQLTAEVKLNERELLPAATVAEAFTRALPADRNAWPTAWVCSTDWLAAKLIVWARGQGLAVPGDVSVVGFDNTRIAEELAEMVITSVVFPYEQVARKAVELLETLVSAPAADAIVWALPPRIRVGETVERV